jgi:hypothetical protein
VGDFQLVTDGGIWAAAGVVKHGFEPLEEEWWHFTLRNEPYPDTHFDFPVR